MNVAGKVMKTKVTADALLGVQPTPEDADDPETALQFVAMLNAALGGTDARD